MADADAFLHTYFETAVWPKERPAPLSWTALPSDYDAQIQNMRRQLGLTQAQFAKRVGAARKAVVYQWESRKRCPSPVFWQRIQELGRGDSVRHPMAANINPKTFCERSSSMIDSGVDACDLCREISQAESQRRPQGHTAS